MHTDARVALFITPSPDEVTDLSSIRITDSTTSSNAFVSDALCCSDVAESGSPQPPRFARILPPYSKKYAWAHTLSRLAERTRKITAPVYASGTRLRFAVWSMRLEEGTYAVPFGAGGAEREREITAQELGAPVALLARPQWASVRFCPIRHTSSCVQLNLHQTWTQRYK